MVYTKTIWENSPSENTPLSAENLNNIENGIEDVDTRLTTAETDIDNIQTGWLSATGTFVFSSWDSTTATLVVTTSVDYTAILSAGDKLKYTHSSTTKYAVIISVTSTTLTLFLGTQYTATSGNLTNVYYSHMKSPFGLPQNMATDSYILMNTTSTGPWNLSLSSTSFSSFDVVYMKSGSYNSMKVPSPNGKTLSMICANAYDSNSLQTIQASINISGKTITKVHEVNFLMNSTPTTISCANSNDINITLITGHIFS